MRPTPKHRPRRPSAAGRSSAVDRSATTIWAAGGETELSARAPHEPRPRLPRPRAHRPRLTPTSARTCPLPISPHVTSCTRLAPGCVSPRSSQNRGGAAHPVQHPSTRPRAPERRPPRPRLRTRPHEAPPRSPALDPATGACCRGRPTWQRVHEPTRQARGEEQGHARQGRDAGGREEQVEGGRGQEGQREGCPRPMLVCEPGGPTPMASPAGGRGAPLLPHTRPSGRPGSWAAERSGCCVGAGGPGSPPLSSQGLFLHPSHSAGSLQGTWGV